MSQADEWQIEDLQEDKALLQAALRRVCDSLATLIREHEDPGTEALAALDEARRLLKP